MKEQNLMQNKALINAFVIMVFLVVFGIGIGVGEWFFRKDRHSDYNHLVRESAILDSLFTIEKAKTERLSAEVDSFRTIYSKEKVIIKNLKDKRDENIRTIDTMDTNSLYKFFSNH